MDSIPGGRGGPCPKIAGGGGKLGLCRGSPRREWTFPRRTPLPENGGGAMPPCPPGRVTTLDIWPLPLGRDGNNGVVSRRVLYGGRLLYSSSPGRFRGGSAVVDVVALCRFLRRKSRSSSSSLSSKSSSSWSTTKTNTKELIL